jgi:uncharacterized membrane protein YfcA
VTSLPVFSTGDWILAAIAAVCIGLNKAGFNSFGIITILIMAHLFPAKVSTGTVLPMLLFADLMAIVIYRRHVSWKDLWQLLPTTVLGLVAGWLLMRFIPESVYGKVLGWMILLMMLVLLWQQVDERLLSKVRNHPLLANGSGFVSGITTMMANAAGPVVTFYLLAKRFEKMAFVGTCAWFFFMINLTKLPLSWNLGLISAQSLLLNLTLLPAVIFGMGAGRLLIGKIPQVLFEWTLIAISTAAAIRLILN